MKYLEWKNGEEKRREKNDEQAFLRVDKRF